MISAIPDLDPDKIGIPENRLGNLVRVFRETASTNDLLLALGEAGEPEGSVLIADSQTAGKGRLGRKWLSIPGVGLYFSVLLRPQKDIGLWGDLTLMTAQCIIQALQEIHGPACRIKPPNDIYVDRRKLAGILVETRSGRNPFAVVGMGINVHQKPADFPSSLKETATSLAMEGCILSRDQLARLILKHFDAAYKKWVLS